MTPPRVLPPSVLAFVALLLPLCLAGAADDEAVAEFKKYFKKFKDGPTRVEAVLTLEGNESPRVVDALLKVLKDEDASVVRASRRVLAGFQTAPPRARVWEVLEKQKDEQVLIGLLTSITDGGYPIEEFEGADEILTDLLEAKAWTVRRRAISAVATTGLEGAVDAVVEATGDDEPAVRCSAIDALALMRSERVLEPARAALSDASWQVRACAIEALGIVRHRDSIEPLIDRMQHEEGRLREDIGRSLGEITGRNFGLRLESWQRFWDTYEDRFQIPTDAELAKLREAQKARAEEYSPPGAVTYYGVETPSRSMLFVIDVSGSMENLVIETERFEDGEYPSFRRIDIVKTELARTIENLEPYVKFNILAFATEIDPWKKDLVSANVINKKSAADWISKLEALGGASKESLAQAGLVGSANLEAGKTNTYGALIAALDAAGPRDAKQDYEVEVDTIFFLSDGRPSTGDYVETDDILREVLAANELRQVVIHTIALGQFKKDFMRILAESSGGVFVDLGR